MLQRRVFVRRQRVDVGPQFFVDPDSHGSRHVGPGSGVPVGGQHRVDLAQPVQRRQQ
ncbi:Uncharacterised protein [Bordetella pertussis]|nr:Uncharacterised protein [Bordetella pertussis]